MNIFYVYSFIFNAEQQIMMHNHHDVDKRLSRYKNLLLDAIILSWIKFYFYIDLF